MNSTITAAIAYAERGWPVLPCAPRGKRPLGRLVPHGLKDATIDIGTIERWFRAVPVANIGLATGVAFDVLDIDGEPGWTSLAHAVQAFGCLSSSPVSLTPAGGGHDLFLPSGLGNRTGFRPGLDWRGTGGYVIAPPSVHDNGGIYEWALDPESTPLEPAPAGRVVLAPVGRRNDALNRAAFALGQLVAGGVLDVDAVIDALLIAAARAGLGEREARGTIASGFRSGASCPRNAPV